MDDVDCAGNETSLFDCMFSPNPTNCAHSEDAGVRCQLEMSSPMTTTPTPTPTPTGLTNYVCLLISRVGSCVSLNLNGCCTRAPCSNLGCFCDQGCFAMNDCCGDINDIGCFPPGAGTSTTTIEASSSEFIDMSSSEFIEMSSSEFIEMSSSEFIEMSPSPTTSLSSSTPKPTPTPTPKPTPVCPKPFLPYIPLNATIATVKCLNKKLKYPSAQVNARFNIPISGKRYSKIFVCDKMILITK